jgi:dTDP-4-dehydrorhamnose reductase
MDIADADSVQRVLEAEQPWALINTAGYVRVDEAEADRARCMRENATGPAILAQACGDRGIQLLTFSSDLVFDGTLRDRAYLECDAVHPLNVYGASKAEAERRVLSVLPTSLVIRTSAFFGPWDIHNFVYHALRTLSQGEEFIAASDGIVSPTYVPDLVHACLDLLIDGETGVWHLANDGAVSWAQLASLAAEIADVSSASLRPRPTATLDLAAARPRATPLASERGWPMPGLEDALQRFVACSTPLKAR